MRGYRAIVASLPLFAAIGATSAFALDLVRTDSDNPFSLKAWLHASAVAAWVDQDDPFDDLRDHTFAFNAELELRGAFTFDDGSQFGAFLEFELDNDNNDAVITDNNDDVIDKAYVFYKSVYGHWQLGATDGVGDQMSFAAPSISRGPRINGGKIYFFEDPFFDVEFRPVALRTDLYASGDNIKIVYFTPRWKGFQAGVSYMPDFTRSLIDFFDPDDGDFDQQSEILEVAANYAGTIGKLDVGVGGAYMTGNNENPAFSFTLGRDHGDIEEWSAGVNLGFGIERLAVRLGASYKNSNVSGGLIFGSSGSGVVDDEIDTDIWDVGVVIARGPWSLGGTYIRGDSEEENFFTASGLSDLDGEAFEIGAGYRLGPGIKLNLAYQHYEYTREPGGFAFFIDDNSDELDTVFLEAAVDL